MSAMKENEKLVDPHAIKDEDFPCHLQLEHKKVQSKDEFTKYYNTKCLSCPGNYPDGEVPEDRKKTYEEFASGEDIKGFEDLEWLTPEIIEEIGMGTLTITMIASMGDKELFKERILKMWNNRDQAHAKYHSVMSRITPREFSSALIESNSLPEFEMKINSYAASRTESPPINMDILTRDEIRKSSAMQLTDVDEMTGILTSWITSKNMKNNPVKN